MLQINLAWDANALAAPQSFRVGVQQAADILQAAIYDPITVMIAVGYGEYDLGGPYYQPLTSGISLGGFTNAQPVSYVTLKSALASRETSTAATEAVNALPDTTSLGNRSTFYLAPALAEALGLSASATSAPDGNIGLPASATGTTLVGLSVTEELHALGLSNNAGDLGLVSYTGPGQHYIPQAGVNAVSAYFSLDGGNTDLANYDVGFDNTLFANQPNDPLDVPNMGVAALTPLDLEEISAIGFDTTGAAPAAASPTAATGAALAVVDTTLGHALPNTSQPYVGPVSGIADEFIDVTADNLNISAGSDNWFIHSGGGMDAIAVHGGTNVLDGGTGSNFLVGAGGTDTFFVDNRGATADTWSTVDNFHAGDAATVWGVTPGIFALNWYDNQGAAGYTGLTLHATAPGKPVASLTLVGYSVADLNNGRLSVQYGTNGGGAYMFIHGDR